MPPPALPPDVEAWALAEMYELLLEDAEHSLISEFASFILLPAGPPSGASQSADGGDADGDAAETKHQEKLRAEERELADFVECLVAPMRADFSPQIAKDVVLFAAEFARRVRESRQPKPSPPAVKPLESCSPSEPERKRENTEALQEDGDDRREVRDDAAQTSAGGETPGEAAPTSLPREDDPCSSLSFPLAFLSPSPAPLFPSSFYSSSPTQEPSAEEEAWAALVSPEELAGIQSFPSSASGGVSAVCVSSLSRHGLQEASSASVFSSPASQLNISAALPAGVAEDAPVLLSPLADASAGAPPSPSSPRTSSPPRAPSPPSACSSPLSASPVSEPPPCAMSAASWQDDVPLPPGLPVSLARGFTREPRETKRVKKTRLQLDAFGLAAGRLSLDGRVRRQRGLFAQKEAKYAAAEARCICLCMGVEHGVHGSCLYCGKVACKMEGGEDCLFCGNRIKAAAEARRADSEVPSARRGAGRGGDRRDRDRWAAADSDGWLEEDRLQDATPEERDLVKQKRLQALRRATALKDRLIHFDRTSAVRSIVYDDATDWFAEAGNIWIDASKRAEASELHAAQQRQSETDRRRARITLDLANKTVVDESQMRAEERLRETEEALQRFHLQCAGGPRAHAQDSQLSPRGSRVHAPSSAGTRNRSVGREAQAGRGDGFVCGDAESDDPAAGGSAHWGGKKIYFDDKKRREEEERLRRPNAFLPLSREEERRQLARLEEIQKQGKEHVLRRWRDEREAEDELAEWEEDAAAAEQGSAAKANEKRSLQTASVQNPVLSSTSRRLLAALREASAPPGNAHALATDLAIWAPGTRSGRGDSAGGFFAARATLRGAAARDALAPAAVELPQGRWQQSLQGRLQEKEEEERRKEDEQKREREREAACGKREEAEKKILSVSPSAYTASSLQADGRKQRLFAVAEPLLFGEEEVDDCRRGEETASSHADRSSVSCAREDAERQHCRGEEESEEDAARQKAHEDAHDEGLCLTVRQPFASLIVAGFKTKEGRDWPLKHRGRLWIHAASTPPDPDVVAGARRFYEQLLLNQSSSAFSSSLEEEGAADAEARAGDAEAHDERRRALLPHFPVDFPTSAVVGCVTVADCREKKETNSLCDETEGFLFDFLLRSPRSLIVPVKMRGNERVWKIDSAKLPRLQGALQKPRWPRLLSHLHTAQE
ncbi:hypothetical protein BESB_053120 [Besnoitia besnoiti]|uniref:Uncharacterized protein n=1 Tax=Besnoitia besnoiti TaxID=94643 RepID=A0A2A9MHB7_BESBE|nr:hypothetical protein BESB_053120 [Besnoitia besnoiti]PFH35661.1 hypothetical protein BESB_053120 [Besnoitia besnoiti]